MRSSGKRYISGRTKYTTSHRDLARRHAIILDSRGSSRMRLHIQAVVVIYPTFPVLDQAEWNRKWLVESLFQDSQEALWAAPKSRPAL